MRESVWPRPAATISGVVPFLDGSRQSAPAATSVCIISTSPYIAASQNARGAAEIPRANVVAAPERQALRRQPRVQVRAARDQRLQQVALAGLDRVVQRGHGRACRPG